MQSDLEQLSTYKSVHLNKVNVKTHFVGVPAIIWSLMVLLSLIEISLPLAGSTLSVNLAIVLFVGVIIYYFMLNIRIAVAQLLIFALLLYSAHIVAQEAWAVWIAALVFVVGWIIQLIGHYYEKAKPAFVDDLNQLLIGPFFLMAEVFFMLGTQTELDKKVTALAIKKRRQFEANNPQ